MSIYKTSYYFCSHCGKYWKTNLGGWTHTLLCPEGYGFKYCPNCRADNENKVDQRFSYLKEIKLKNKEEAYKQAQEWIERFKKLTEYTFVTGEITCYVKWHRFYLDKDGLYYVNFISRYIHDWTNQYIIDVCPRIYEKISKKISKKIEKNFNKKNKKIEGAL